MTDRLDDIPALNRPWLVAAFEGWNDAADAATGTVDHLIEACDAEVFAELDPQDYYDFQQTRPVMAEAENGMRELVWPMPTVFVARVPKSDRDLLLLRAVEPNLRWRDFADNVVEMAQAAGVTEVITLGALLADTPHTLPVPVSGTTTDPQMMERLALEQSRYTGPVGITTVLGDAAAREGMVTASLWAAVPHYLAEPPCPKATLALLGALEDALGVPLPQGVLPELSQAWQRGAAELTEQDSDLAEYVASLEAERQDDLPGADGDTIAREFERYLRRRPDDSA